MFLWYLAVMKGPLYRVVAAFLIYALSGCIYENEGSYVNPVQPPDPGLTRINISNIGERALFKPVLVTLDVSPSDKGEYTALVEVDGVTMATPTSTYGTLAFVLNTQVLTDGEHTLRVTVYFPSLSPSLAGQLRAEYIQAVTEYKFRVDKAPPARMKAPAVSIEDGKSMLRWKKPEKFNFNELVIVRMYYKSGSHLDTDTLKLADPAVEVFHDASYVGGEVRYRIDIRGYQYVIQGEEANFNINPVPFTIEEKIGPPVLNIPKSPLYNNDIRMNVYYFNSYPLNQDNVIPTYVRFGQPDIVPVTVYPTSPAPGQEFYRYSFNIPVRAGKQIPAFDFVKFIPGANAYLMSARNQVYKVDGTSFQTLASISLPRDVGIVCSQDGNHIYAYGYDQLYKLNASTLSVVETIDLTALVGVNQGLMYAPSVSNDNVMAIALYGQQKKQLIDMNSRLILENKTAMDMPVLSPDGQYLIVDRVIYKKSNDNWNTVHANVPGSNLYSAGFRQDSKNELLVINNGMLEVYDLPSMAQKTVPSVALTYLNYDSNTETYFVPTGSSIGDTKVIDANTFEEVGTPVTTWEISNVRYVNGHFFHRSGSVMPNL